MTETARPLLPAPAAPPEPGSSGRLLARAAFLTAVLTVAGAVLGLLRDQAFAHVFGADTDTDAFLVAWTVPEVAATLLIEDGLAFVLVPAFSLALVKRGRPGPDPVRALVAATLPRLTLALTAGAAVVIAAAPAVVAVLAPGLPRADLAVDCTRLTATCVFTFGLTGYCSAALRGHGRFLAPASIYVAYNVGIIALLLLLGGAWGVRAAAAGVALGGVLMVLIQLPALWRSWHHRERPATVPAARREPGDSNAGALRLALVAPIVVFALSRQTQVLIERFLAAPLPAGAISHLNYAQKVAQMPMVLSLMLCTVTFPLIARALAAGDTERARRRVESDLIVAGTIVLLGASVVVACAPQIIHLLFQRGAFTAHDTAATAAVMRVYALGLLGQTLVGVLARSYFSEARPLWFPACAMLAGLTVTAVAGTLAVPVWGAPGIAAANALGITLTALLLLWGSGRRRTALSVRWVGGQLARLVVAACGATAAAWWGASAPSSPLFATAFGALAAAVTFAVVARLLRVREFCLLFRPVTRKLRHAR
ncbi:murein biosynthesis integral membrane protein MurJ [Streptomyces sp. NBC_00083]|uniref:murein biosynthesis integral membrane protein MurJ n=1 Tax=Streptomyces sp. NBC_00083 TaxID=2975647 RepID=UPI0022561E25|nr:lipid II flippase MurJ [Streptomyces sp. NBC_00083]MCX5381766.1 murein biosynthesis protein MurJ [Streptomyces sp. NBC_00083]